MKRLLLLMASGILFALFSGCAYEKYGEYTVQAINTVSGVSAGMSKDGDLLVLARDDDRQAVFISGNRADQEKILSCSNAPILYVAVHFFGKKNTSVLRIELPAKGKKLKFYRYREIGDKLFRDGKKVWIMDVKEVSPDGKELRVLFETEGQHGRQIGTYYPETNMLMVR